MSFNFSRKRFTTTSQPIMGRDFLRGGKTFDFPSIAAGANSETTITVTGASVGDDVLVVWNVAPPAGLIFSARVTATDTVTLRAQNPTAGAVDAASQAYRVLVLKV